MYSVGVPMTVGFKSTVGADDDYYGELSVINRFDDHLFNYMAGQGKCLSLAINYAAADVYYQSVDHYYFGVDSIEYTGGSSYLP